MSAAEEFYGLTAFKRDCLVAAAAVEESGETSYGLAIKRNLEARYDEEVNHGRLYPNLDDLVEAGLLSKSALDKRTNEYVPTDAAYELLRVARDGLDAVVSDDSGAESKRAVADGGVDDE